MIKIDEIYHNVFAASLQHNSNTCIHWFDPFGSTKFQDLIVEKPIIVGHRIVFWDQEPLYRTTAADFFDQFCPEFRPPRPPEFHTRLTLVTSEINSTDVQWIQQRYQIESTDYYFFHGWAALDWFRGYNFSYLNKPWMERIFDYDWICPNNIIKGRQHRLKWLHLMVEKDILSRGLMSFPVKCPYSGELVLDLMEQAGWTLSNTVKLPLIIDAAKCHANDSHKIDFWDYALRCFAHVVTETTYCSDRIQLTEKTFKPIVLQQPFLLVAAKGSLSYLKSYGFRTFDCLWDESYDLLDDENRIDAIADICYEISRWTPAQIKHAKHVAWPIIQHNFNWFYHDFQNVLWREIQNMVSRW